MKSKGPLNAKGTKLRDPASLAKLRDLASCSASVWETIEFGGGNLPLPICCSPHRHHIRNAGYVGLWGALTQRNLRTQRIVPNKNWISTPGAWLRVHGQPHLWVSWHVGLTAMLASVRSPGSIACNSTQWGYQGVWVHGHCTAKWTHSTWTLVTTGVFW